METLRISHATTICISSKEKFGFSRNYFLAKEMGSSGKKSARKLSGINVVDEQELREASANIEPKHQNDVAVLINSYKSSYPKWVFDLSDEGTAPAE
ncbi:hypothetical protein ES332_D11G269700v1 [Gossypium tomentosum]|uniref:Uncharacterized protein n=1 Tax=Gossypium tomentosum TaxID=34277 RepID=A0A5D2IS98_GOSTO|nr:hypothetical protein ES332_D11G269700v1 [Gossypium tomentosum]